MKKRTGPRYAIIPADAVTDENLSGPDLRVLALLGRHIDRKGWCVRSQGRMATEIHVARGTLQRSLGRLVDAGYVEVSHERRRDGGQAANRYRVVLDEQARADQLDLFFGTDAVQFAGADQHEGDEVEEAPPASQAMHPLPHPSEAPPASSRRGTHRNVPFGTSPWDAPAAQRASGTSVDHRQQGAVPADLNATSNVVPLRLPDAVPALAGADLDGSALSRRLTDAAGAAINSASPAFLNLAEPYGWLGAGCDLEADVVPTVAGLAARHSGPPLRSWRYFTAAVLEARDRRCAAATRGTAPARQTPARMKSVGSRLADAMGRIARGEDAFPLPDERTIDVAARR